MPDMTHDQHLKKVAGFNDASVGNRNELLAGDSWYEQGYMEGVASTIKAAADNILNIIRNNAMGGIKAEPVRGVNEAISAFFITLANQNGIKEDRQHMEDEIRWTDALTIIATQYVNFNRSEEHDQQRR